jgi:hypothetical protein
MRQFFHQQGQAARQYSYMWHWRVNIIIATPSDNRNAMIHYTCFAGSSSSHAANLTRSGFGGAAPKKIPFPFYKSGRIAL